MSEDTPPFSADSGMCCESDSEPVTSLSEPLTPDAWSHAFPEGPEDGQSSLVASEALPKLEGPVEVIEEHGRWLATCIQALEREVAEEELAQVDRAVDALDRREMFTGQLPATRQDLPCVRDSAGLRKALGDKLSSLRRRLSTRRLPKAESSQGRVLLLPLGGGELVQQDGLSLQKSQRLASLPKRPTDQPPRAW